MARILRDYPHISLIEKNLGDTVDFVQIFGREAPVHIEIGSGNGTFILNEAKNWPDINFLGIEWASKYYRRAVDRIGRWAVEHIRMIRADAAVFIAELIADGSVDCFHIYFPDPWPKKRHHKRRFVNLANTEQMLRCLKTGGTIRIATDHAGYYDQVLGVMTQIGGRIEQIDFSAAVSANKGEYTGTNYERKYILEQRQIHTIAVKKMAQDKKKPSAN